MLMRKEEEGEEEEEPQGKNGELLEGEKCMDLREKVVLKTTLERAHHRGEVMVRHGV